MIMENLRVKILKIKEAAEFTKSFVLEKPKGFKYKAGQHGFIEIGPENGKPFSFVSSPNEDIIEFATIIRDKSGWKQELNNKKEGEELILSGPYGHFGYEEDERDLGFIAGGIGITPFMGILRYLTEEEKDTKVTLLYSCRNERAIAFKDELDRLAEENKNIRIVYTITDDKRYLGNKGRINEDFIKNHVDNIKDKVWYIAGPPLMVIEMKRILGGLGAKKLKLDAFSGY